MIKKAAILSVLLVLPSCAGTTGVSQLGQVQQAVGCRCGNSYISCNDICHIDGGGTTGASDFEILAGVLVIAGIGLIYLAVTAD